MPTPFPPLPVRCHLLAIAAVLTVGAWSGCTHDKSMRKERLKRGEHAVRVNATSLGPVKPGTPFVITPPPRDPGAESTLLYAEAARLVKSALMARGLYEAPGRAQAGVIVEVEYSMETPRVTQATPSDPAAGNAARNDPRASATDANVRSAERGPLAKNLVLTAREAKRTDGPPRTLWTVELSTTDTSNDLRKYLPLLAAAAVEQIGKDSDGPQTVKISETDKTVALMKAK